MRRGLFTPTVYVVERESRYAVSHDIRPEGWTNQYLTPDLHRGDVIVGRIELYGQPRHRLPGEERGAAQYMLYPVGLVRVEGRCVTSNDSAECVCNALDWADAVPVVAYTRGDCDMIDVLIRQSRIGGIWRPVERIEADLARYTPEVLARVPDCEVIEARLTAAGETTAIVRYDDGYQVLEWGIDQVDGGEYQFLEDLTEHNQLITQANREWRNQ